MRWLLFSIVAFGWAVCLGLSGCGSTTTTNPLSAPATAIHDPAEGSAADAGIAAALEELPIEDKSLAETQKICPVSGELLGTMGAPIKVDVNGQPVFICCEGCKDKLLSKPEEYLAKLKK